MEPRTLLPTKTNHKDNDDDDDDKSDQQISTIIHKLFKAWCNKNHVDTSSLTPDFTHFNNATVLTFIKDTIAWPNKQYIQAMEVN